MKKKKHRLYSLGCFVAIIGIWCALTYSGYLKPMYLPTPTSVVNAVIDKIKDGTLMEEEFIVMKQKIMGMLHQMASDASMGK